MAEFRGTKNLRIGHPAWAVAEYDHTTKEHVITVTGEDVERFRSIAGRYGFHEVGGDTAAPAEPVAPPAPPVEPTPDPDADSDEGDESDHDADGDEDPEPEPTPEPSPRRGRGRRASTQE